MGEGAHATAACAKCFDVSAFGNLFAWKGEQIRLQVKHLPYGVILTFIILGIGGTQLNRSLSTWQENS